MPSEDVFRAFDKAFFKAGVKRRWRWHPKCEDIERYKNRWDMLEQYLKKSEGRVG